MVSALNKSISTHKRFSTVRYPLKVGVRSTGQFLSGCHSYVMNHAGWNR